MADKFSRDKKHLFPDRDRLDYQSPPGLAAIETETARLGFDMPSATATGALLRALAAQVSGGNLLELGTGTGIATCWLLDGLDPTGRLVSVDNDTGVQTVARTFLGQDSRLTLIEQDGVEFIDSAAAGSFDLVFADAWPGKFERLDAALQLVKIDGIYIGDDLLPQPNWPPNHAPRVAAFIETLQSRSDFEVEYWPWSSGILLARRLCFAKTFSDSVHA